MNEFNQNCPCKKCTERHQGCHSSCELYITWRKDLDKKNDELREYKDARYGYHQMFRRDQPRSLMNFLRERDKQPGQV